MSFIRNCIDAGFMEYAKTTRPERTIRPVGEEYERQDANIGLINAVHHLILKHIESNTGYKPDDDIYLSLPRKEDYIDVGNIDCYLHLLKCTPIKMTFSYSVWGLKLKDGYKVGVKSKECIVYDKYFRSLNLAIWNAHMEFIE